MSGFLGYAAASAAVLIGLALLLGAWLDAAGASAVWLAAGVAYLVQLGTFAGLLAGRRRPNGFLAALAGGALVRLLAVGGLGAWVMLTDAPAAAPLLLSAAGFLFLLTLMEPVFYRPRPEGR